MICFFKILLKNEGNKYQTCPLTKTLAKLFDMDYGYNNKVSVYGLAIVCH